MRINQYIKIKNNLKVYIREVKKKIYELLFIKFPYIYEIYEKFRYYYLNLRNYQKYHKEFISRIKKIDLNHYIGTSNKPNLNVIIICIDALRYSNLSSHFYQYATTPFLNSLNSNFKAISPSPFTYPAVASILSGFYPSNHGAIIKGKIKNFHALNFQSIKEKVLTLPEVLYLLGYEIYFASAISPACYPFMTRVKSIKTYPNINCHKIFNNLKKWISKKKKPFFAYCHLGDLHIPINPPRNFKNYFGKVKSLHNIKEWDYQKYNEQNGLNFEEYKKNRILLYDNTLRYIDYTIENFYTYLEKKNLLKSTILIVTADHGEEFWEYSNLEAKNFFDPRGVHGIGHGHNVFNKIIEVPILISGPGIPKKKTNQASLIDIMPTILDLLKIKHNIKFDGMNIFNINKDRLLLTEATAFGYEKKALIYRNYKLIYSEHDKVQWVFDLNKDPMEKSPITDKKITSIFVEKLFQYYTSKEKNRIRDIAKKLFK